MKVLWIVNMMVPELAEHLGKKTGVSGTWLINLSKSLSLQDDIELAVACVAGDEFVDVKIGEIRYFCIPGNGKTMMFYHPELVNYWRKIEELFAPDIVHFHGTEYTHGISYLREFPNKKKLLTIQGIIGKVSQNHWGNLGLNSVLKNRTLRESIKLNGMLERKILSKRNVRYENELIKGVQFATGRTDWDKYYMKSLNPNLKYFHCGYNLRDEFYKADKWSVENCTRHLVYASTSAQVPMKGGDIVMKAIDIVRRSYPDCKFIFLAGKVNNGMLVPNSGYTKYICKLIKKLGIDKNVEFIPAQNTQGVIDIMQKSNVTVIPSAIENASATLREAMHLGVPCVASFRGGMTELIDDRQSGFLYDFTEYEFLAGRIMEIFANDDLAEKLSKNAIAKAEKWHHQEKNVTDMLNCYRYISGIEV